MPANPNLLTPEQVAERLGVSKSVVYKWARKGRLPFIRISRNTLRFSAKNIEEYLRTHTPGGV